MKSEFKSAEQKNELFRHIFKVAEELRGKVDGWDFKAYVLGFLFYRYISENIKNYLNENEWNAINGNKDFDYSKLDDSEIDDDLKNQIIDEKGFFIYPSHLFENIYKNNINNKENLNEIISNVFKSIENSAIGRKGESNIKGIFSGISFNSDNLGTTVLNRNINLIKIISRLANLNLGNFDDKEIDIFGDAYEYLMAMYASNAGKSGGEYFTPYEVSKLLTLLAINGKEKIHKVYDPACGSGSLLLHAEKLLGKENVKIGFFGQESNPGTYNLCRMNMFLHNINYEKFDIRCGDTLVEPGHSLNEKYDVIVSNPPYSIKWPGKNNPLLINDERFSKVGVLAPSSKADYAFILHCLYLLDINGYAAIVCYPGIFYRCGVEKKIRKYLVDYNYIELIMLLPKNLFFGTPTETNIMVLSKSKKNNDVLFIDASNEYIKSTNQNKLSDKNIEKILDVFLNKNDINSFSKNITIEEIIRHNYDLSVSNYVTKKYFEEEHDLKSINEEIKKITKKTNSLKKEIDLIVKELENEKI